MECSAGQLIETSYQHGSECGQNVRRIAGRRELLAPRRGIRRSLVRLLRNFPHDLSKTSRQSSSPPALRLALRGSTGKDNCLKLIPRVLTQYCSRTIRPPGASESRDQHPVGQLIWLPTSSIRPTGSRPSPQSKSPDAPDPPASGVACWREYALRPPWIRDGVRRR